MEGDPGQVFEQNIFVISFIHPQIVTILTGCGKNKLDVLAFSNFICYKKQMQSGKPLNINERHSATWVGRTRKFGESTRDETIKDFLKFKKGARVLDLGCGDGIVSEHLLTKEQIHVFAADFSREALNQTKKRGVRNLKKFNFCKTFPYRDSFFDFVIWLDNAEHLTDPAITLSEIKRVLRTGGKLIITVPNMGFFMYRLYYMLKGNVPGTDGVRPNGYVNEPWEWEHIRFFNRDVLKGFLQKNNFKILKFGGYNYNPFFHRFAQKFPELLSHGIFALAQK